MQKISIQYVVLGFEPTTFRIWVSSHYHKTRAPALSPPLSRFVCKERLKNVSDQKNTRLKRNFIGDVIHSNLDSKLPI